MKKYEFTYFNKDMKIFNTYAIECDHEIDLLQLKRTEMLLNKSLALIAVQIDGQEPIIMR